MSKSQFIFYPNEESPVFKIEVEKLVKPVYLIYNAFPDEGEISDTFFQLSRIVAGYIDYATSIHIPAAIRNEVSLPAVEKLLLITQLLSACAMISNSMEVLIDPNE